ncbi:MAG: ABC transporter permease [Candidatus Korarchaeota archaeon]|nr:ABC transporter permease [Candidatus Korarchaeota archaeon]NIU82330.1 ABC transporter permease subunit [Candidatus Thorarchaeota archaeon]NIW12814.1 ABC transporter permease subunit [Candidatus Thorarchaeota archaeon]NIW51011.1 ABC transporter permease subunit [Candidatus Korarchaeota archaeon]
MPVPPREYSEYGLTLFTLYSEIPDWTEMGNSQLQYMEFKDIFTKGRKLTLTFAMNLQITEPNLEQRGVGNFSVLMDKITGIGQSHYFGLMGTTAKGSDLFSLVMRGARISLLIGISATAINIIIGALAGLLAGYYGGITDEFIMRVVDVGLVIPLLPLQIVLISIFQKLEVNPFFPLLLALTVTGWVGSARVIRSQVLVEKKKPYIEAAKASGCPNWHIMIYHIFPNVISLIFMYIMLGITNAILAEAVLSFLGLGPQWVSWGRILQEAALPGLGGGRTGGLGGTLFEAWWNMFFPGIFLTSVSIGFMFTGHTMEEIFQPERRT